MQNEMRQSTTASSWCVIAQIREETPFGEEGKETKIGSKHFKPNAKVYIVDWHPGMCKTVTVVGHHRRSNKLITIDIHVKYLTDLESKVAYKPYVLERIAERKMMGTEVMYEEQAEDIRNTVETWIHEETD
ncbi:hypothetical protein [Cerasicoccus frondis]|uniref:hypothetical protein n=1 Tax=Cerasicoccus frondis TaxID=490090 RepID=UPI00285277F0|nr:hypothetical protein [Cerasicoccus frondis]